MKLTEALKQLLGLTAQVNAKLDKIATPAPKPAAEGKDDDGDEDDDECADCEGSGKCSSCGGTGKMEGDAEGDADAKGCSHTAALAKANQSLTEASTKIDAQAATIKDLQTKLDAANKQVTDLTAENTKLKEDLAKSKNATTAAIAAVGIPADKLPETTAPAPDKSKDAFSQYQAMIESDPIGASRFYSENREAILKARQEAFNS